MADFQALAKHVRQTLFFFFVLFTVTLGPLLFGYHLVSSLSLRGVLVLLTDWTGG